MNLFKISSVILFAWQCFYSVAQVSVDSVKQLIPVEIIDSKLKQFAAGTKVKVVDSALLQTFQVSNLADLLSAENSIFIKSYGSGSLATTSFRGGSANHTTILWNGFNLNSPMNGLLDLSLVPNNFINEITVQYGGSSALWGSGAVGGTIQLNNNANYNTGITASAGATVGSFNDFRQHVSVEYSGKRFITSLKIFNHSAENNYPFYNTYLKDAPKKYQRNNELKQYGLLFENYFQINKHQKINIRFWYQDNDRNIPPTMLQLVNQTNQKDKEYRYTSEWQRTGEKAKWFIRAAYFNERLIYSDFSYNYVSPNHAQSVITESEVRIRLYSDHLLNIGINNTFLQAVTDGYTYNPKQNRTSAFLSYNYRNQKKNFSTTLSARQEFIQNKTAVPFTYSGGADLQILKFIGLKVSASKVYRTPTFNDLYWIPGGNPNLLSESGYCEEAGLEFKYYFKKLRTNVSFEPTVFNRDMENWVIWLPQLSYWTPQNIMKVRSRGMETITELKFESHGLKIKLNVTTNYVLSTNEKSKSANDASVDKQLIYTPMYSGKGAISVGYKGFYISYNHTYTGYRYTSTDNKEFLKPYQLANVYVSKRMVFKKVSFNVFIQLNNIFNEKYQVLQSRAMPLINFQGGISIQFNQYK